VEVGYVELANGRKRKQGNLRKARPICIAVNKDLG
jgi:hypothetical protein